MPARSSRLIRHNDSKAPRVGGLNCLLVTLDQFPNHDIGFRLPLSAFQELEEQILLYDVLRHASVWENNRNVAAFKVHLESIKHHYPRSRGCVQTKISGRKGDTMPLSFMPRFLPLQSNHRTQIIVLVLNPTPVGSTYQDLPAI